MCCSSTAAVCYNDDDVMKCNQKHENMINISEKTKNSTQPNQSKQ